MRNRKTIKQLAFGLGAFFGIASIALLMLIAFSPYKKDDGIDRKRIKVSVNINASRNEVFTYLGNSSHAAQWSSFVDHITPLNLHEKADGALGSIRRCYKNEDESSMYWDEETLVVEENKYRPLSCYNFQDFKLTANNIRTEQLYEVLDEGTTRLSFTLYFGGNKTSFIDELKLYYAAYQVAPIFEANLQNIKYIVESAG